jgi:hypothetical protein
MRLLFWPVGFLTDRFAGTPAIATFSLYALAVVVVLLLSKPIAGLSGPMRPALRSRQRAKLDTQLISAYWLGISQLPGHHDAGRRRVRVF